MSPSLTRPRFRPNFMALEERLLCSLTPVANTAQFPNSAIIHVTDWFDTNHDGKLDAGDGLAEASGVMIGPDTALTSAHVVYDSTLGGFATGVTSTPGQNGNHRPFGTFAATAWVVPTIYTNPLTSDPIDTATDIAVLHFNPIHRNGRITHIGALTGWLTPKAYSARGLQGVTFTNVGYPADTFSGRNQFQSSGPLLASQQFESVGILRYSNLTIPIEAGSSGSPLFRRTKSGTFIVGLTEATLVGAEMNLATEITGGLENFIHTAEQVSGGRGQAIPFAPSTGTSSLPPPTLLAEHRAWHSGAAASPHPAAWNAAHAELAHAARVHAGGQS
jgi:V8-like Glu-specific endopeptidase